MRFSCRISPSAAGDVGRKWLPRGNDFCRLLRLIAPARAPRAPLPVARKITHPRPKREVGISQSGLKFLGCPSLGGPMAGGSDRFFAIDGWRSSPLKQSRRSLGPQNRQPELNRCHQRVFGVGITRVGHQPVLEARKEGARPRACRPWKRRPAAGRPTRPSLAALPEPDRCSFCRCHKTKGSERRAGETSPVNPQASHSIV